MDKRVIFAVAGSGKTTYIVESLSSEKRSLIVTYTNGNHENLFRKILQKFDGVWPDNITVMSYFQFLYRFCYRPFLSDRWKAKGLYFDSNPNNRISQRKIEYYMTSGRYFYSNRLSLFLEKTGVLNDIRNRIETYFDEFIVDEVQDIAGRDFNFLEQLMDANVNMLFVGDFYQHTYDTSRDGNVNKNLFEDRGKYEKRFLKKGFVLDANLLSGSWRCSQNVCEYVSNQLGIAIVSNRPETECGNIYLIEDADCIRQVMNDKNIIKLHFRNGPEHGAGHKNWGETKGEDFYQDVCVVLNKTTAKSYEKGTLNQLKPSTRNKLYVAITRAHRNVYFVKEEDLGLVSGNTGGN